jgi:hypothetical protein
MLSRHPLDDRQPQTTGELTAPVVEAAEQLGLVFITARSLELIISRLRDKVLRETGQTLPLRARRGLGAGLSLRALGLIAGAHDGQHSRPAPRSHNPRSTAITAASTRECTSSLRRIAFTCSLTVPSEMPNSRAMVLLLWPSAR